jgi:hypothetical protein
MTDVTQSRSAWEEGFAAPVLRPADVPLRVPHERGQLMGERVPRWPGGSS